MKDISVGVIQQSLMDIVTCLERHIIFNNICRIGNRISWNNYTKGIIKKTYYPFEYQRIIDEKQYSILFSDLSALQFYYEFNRDSKLIAARLAFYPNPELTLSVGGFSELEDLKFRDEIYDHMFSIIDIMTDLNVNECLFPTNTSHIRFDYDESALSHSKSHFQISSINKLRMDTNFVLLPKVFLKFCKNLINIDGLELSEVLSIENEEIHFNEFDDDKRVSWHMRYLKTKAATI